MSSQSRSARSVSEKWIRNPSDRAAIAAGCYFDQAAADHVCGFVETFLRHSIGQRWAAKPFLLQPWQRDYLSRLFGWKRANGFRRFRETYLEVPKKNGKSSMLAAVALYLIFEEPGAEVYVGAVNRKQARIVFAECSRMVAASPALRRHLHVIDTHATITFPRMNGKLEAMSADVAGKDGLNASGCILDECHRFRNRGLYDVMKYAGVARSQSLLVNITTAGTDRYSLCYQLHQRGRAVLDGTVDEIDFLPVIYSADETDDLDDPRVWRKANPSLGVILSEDDFRAEWEQAKRIPSQTNNFKRLRFNLWVEVACRWLPFNLWDPGAVPIDPSELLGQPCYAGLDLSSVKDLTSLSLVFPIGDRYRLASYCWIPAETATERADSDGVPYPEWVRAGHMIETPGNATDYQAIRSKLLELRKDHDIISVAFDPWNAQSLCNDLIDDEFDVVEIRQVFANLTNASKLLERLLLDGRLDHDGSPVTRWAVGNCATVTDAQGNIMPSKKRSTERIDPVASLVNALALVHREKPGPKPRITILSQD